MRNVFDLTPSFKPDNEVSLEGNTPEWAKSLIIANCRIETLTEEGTFTAAIPRLKHFAEMGVNGIWLNPVHEHSPLLPRFSPRPDAPSVRHGYGFFDHEKLCSELGSEDDFRLFVEEAHKLKIRIFYDAVPHGVTHDAPIVKEHPDWIKKDENGNMTGTWAMLDFDFENEDCLNWYVNACANWVLKFNLDGIRCDVEPFVTGPELVWSKVRKKCYDAGKKIIIFSEHPTHNRGAFDFEQIGIGNIPGKQFSFDSRNFFMENNIVDCVKNTGYGMHGEGAHRLYTFAVSCHDSPEYRIGGNVLKFGYQALFSPFIPLFFVGEEWNNDYPGQLLYTRYIDWSLLDNENHKTFYDTVCRMIFIRKSYPEIFEYFPENHRESNICSVKTDSDGLTAYARFFDKKAILIIPNNTETETYITAEIPFAEMNIHKPKFSAKELLFNSAVKATDNTVAVSVKPNSLAVVLIE
ncbi:MAG: hypothetical protein IKD04_09450 [Clostridia bacterium]|nr:hypothetical protein [Clostridia bacterium]